MNSRHDGKRKGKGTGKERKERREGLDRGEREKVTKGNESGVVTTRKRLIGSEGQKRKKSQGLRRVRFKQAWSVSLNYMKTIHLLVSILTFVTT